MSEWHDALQKARAIYKKIESTPLGPERDQLVEQHKALLREARENLPQVSRDENKWKMR